MRWFVKSVILGCMSRVPAGRIAYHRLQKTLGTNKLDFRESMKRSLELIEMIRTGGVEIEGMHCVEIGTGWRPFVPMFMRIAGAERIVTYDVNPWLDQQYAFETCKALRENIDSVAAEIGISSTTARERLPEITSSSSLSEILELFHIEYRCPGDARATQLETDSVDVVLSSNVLEHIPHEVLKDIHNESFRILRPGGVVAHRFNPGDHFSHSDTRITGSNFLKYSDKSWYWIGGSGLAFHNRMRCAEHLDLFCAAGFEIVEQRVRRDLKAEQAVTNGELIPHAKYANYSVPDLCADYMWVTAQVPENPMNRPTNSSSEHSGISHV